MPTTYKILGQAAPGATTNTTLYTAPSNTQTVISTIVVANRVNTSAAYRIALRPAGATLANEHYIAYDVNLGGLDSTTLSIGITLGPQDVITVYSTNANLSFNALGSEITS